MGIKVCKFGGTSMADAAAIKNVANIVKSDASRRFVVVSAPGKRFKGDEKITDLLYSAFEKRGNEGDFDGIFSKIKERFDGITADLGLVYDLNGIYSEIERGIKGSETPDYAASRGEYLSALILAEYLGFEFLDAKDFVKFGKDGVFDSEKTDKATRKVLKNLEKTLEKCPKNAEKAAENIPKNAEKALENAEKTTENPQKTTEKMPENPEKNDVFNAEKNDGLTKKAVIPGFYGANEFGEILTFSRGGSDVTGSIIARAANAEIYENWTDVDGFLTADPRIVKNPKLIDYLSYRELRELSYMGASVFHHEAIFPVKKAGIPINVKNTFAPETAGTMIVPFQSLPKSDRVVTGIAGKKGYSVINIEKSLLNNEIGFVRKVLSVLEAHKISFEHMPTGIDTMSVVLSDGEFKPNSDALLREITAAVAPDTIAVSGGLSLIAVVGHGMARKIGTAATVCGALFRAGINIKMIDQGSSELNIIVAVDTADYEGAIKAVYEEFNG